MAKNKRRSYLINPKFQLKFGLYLGVLILVLGVTYPTILYQMVGQMAISVKSCLPNAPKHFEASKLQFALVLIGIQAFTIVIVLIGSIFFTHRIAGPLYKLSKYFKALGSGASFEPLKFRQGDYFQDLAQDYNDALGKVFEKSKEDFQYIEEIQAYLTNLTQVVPDDKRIVLAEINSKLTEIQSRWHK